MIPVSRFIKTPSVTVYLINIITTPLCPCASLPRTLTPPSLAVAMVTLWGVPITVFVRRGLWCGDISTCLLVGRAYTSQHQWQLITTKECVIVRCLRLLLIQTLTLQPSNWSLSINTISQFSRNIPSCPFAETWHNCPFTSLVFHLPFLHTPYLKTAWSIFNLFYSF